MNLSLLRFFKKEKADTAVVEVAVAAPPPLEKPASERFGKTVMPNVARVMDPASGAIVPPSPNPGANPFPLDEIGGPKMNSPRPASSAPARTIALQLSDLLPQLPAELLQRALVDPHQRVILNAAELERGMANGRPAVLLRSIYQQAPMIFSSEVGPQDAREIPLPFHLVLEQFASLQVRHDQEASAAVPVVETPFLQVTLEDEKKFNPANTSVWAPAATPPPAPVVAPEQVAQPAPASTPAPSIPPLAPIRLSLQKEETALPESPAAASVPLPPAPAAPPAAPKIIPNGAGAPIPERVPASSGSSAPISLPSPLAPVTAKAPAPALPPKPTPLPTAAAAAPARIPFKVTPPASDICPPPVLPLRPASSALAFSDDGPRIHLSLRAILREIPPFQLTGPIDHVPEDAQIELPFGIVEAQLSLGRVAISPAQFQAAMPEEFRSLYKLDDGGVPVPLPLPEIMQNLPNQSLLLRLDQEEAEVSQMFETPFSQKADEDAARMKTPSGPIAKQVPVVPEPVLEIEPEVAAEVVAAIVAEPEPEVVAEVAAEPEVAAQVVPEVAAEPKPEVVAEAAPAVLPPPVPAVPRSSIRTALQTLLDTDDALDAKSVVVHASRLPGVSACAVVFSDGLSLAGNIPDVYEADALCAMAPEIVKRIDEQMKNANLGDVRGMTVYCAKAPVSFFAHSNICFAALHSAGEIAAEIRERLARVTEELSRMYAPSPNA